jgi:coatomer protein complex subunit epsilon
MNVQILCGTVLARAGDAEQALALLQKHEGSLDA